MTQPLSIPSRDRLLLAYACTEWASALTHLSALRQVGCRVSDEVVASVADELGSFTAMWNSVEGTQRPPMAAAEHARTWLTDHIEELDALLKEVEVSGRGQKV